MFTMVDVVDDENTVDVVEGENSFKLLINIANDPLNAGVYTVTIKAGTLGSYSTTVTITSCAAITGTHTVSIGEIMSPVKLYGQLDYQTYINECSKNTFVRNSVLKTVADGET